jgi:ADP-heptose:LPS heptosyltransferase
LGIAAQEAKRHLLVVHAGGLGDLVLLSELIASLKQAHPENAVTLLCRTEFTEIVDCYPVAPDEVIGLPFQPYAWAEPGEELQTFLRTLLSQLAGRRVAVLVEASLRPNWLAEFLAAALEPTTSIRCALGVCPTGLLLTLLQAFALNRRSFRNLDFLAGTHERERYRLLVESLDLPFVRVLPWPPQRCEQSALDWLQRHGLNRGRYLICAPFGAASTPIKRWPMQSFADVLRRFYGESGWPVLLMGDQTEAASLASMESLLPDVPTWRFAGRPEELPLAAGILSMAGAYLANDAGLMHLAQAFEVPGTAIFGGGGEWPAYAPWAQGSVGLCNPLPCFGCRWDCFLGHGLCVESIPEERVFEALCAVSGRPSEEPGNIILQTVGEPLLGLVADASARYRETERNLFERLEVIFQLERSRREWTARESDLLVRLTKAEAHADEMERIATERLTVLEEVHGEAARRLDLIHEISRQAEARRQNAEELAGALAQSEAARLQLERTLAPELPSPAEGCQ